MRKVKLKKHYSAKIFARQIARLMEQHGINQNEFNQKIEVPQGATKWKTGVNTPSADSLLAIKKAFGVSIDWLLTGEEESLFSLAQMPAEPYQSQPQPALNGDLLGKIQSVIKQVLKETKTKLTDAQAGRLIARLYAQCSEEKNKPDVISVKRQLLLVD